MPTPNPRFSLHRAGKIAVRTVGTSIALIAASAATAQATEGGEPPAEPTDGYTTPAPTDVPGADQQAEPAEQSHVDEPPTEEAPAEETRHEEAPADESQSHHEEAPVEQAPAPDDHAHEETPAEQAPAEEPHHEETPAEQAPTEDYHRDEAPAEETPAQDAAAGEQAPADAPRDDTHSDEAPTSAERPAGDVTDPNRAAEIPQAEAPVVEAPVVEAASEDQHTTEASRVETPPADVVTAQAPRAEATPVESTPVTSAPEARPVSDAQAVSMPGSAPVTTETQTTPDDQPPTVDMTAVVVTAAQGRNPDGPQGLAPVAVQVETVTQQAAPAQSVPADCSVESGIKARKPGTTPAGRASETPTTPGDCPEETAPSVGTPTGDATPALPTVAHVPTVPQTPDWWTMLFTPRDDRPADQHKEARPARSHDDVGHEGAGHESDGHSDQDSAELRDGKDARGRDEAAKGNSHSEEHTDNEAAAVEGPAKNDTGKAEDKAKNDKGKNKEKGEGKGSAAAPEHQDDAPERVTAETVRAWLEEIVSPGAVKSDKASTSSKDDKSDRSDKPSKAEKSGSSKKDEKDGAPSRRSANTTRDDDRGGPAARVITLSRTKNTERSTDSEETSTSRTDDGPDVRDASDAPAAVVRKPAKARTSTASAEESEAPEPNPAESPAEPRDRGPANESETPAERDTPASPAQTAPARPAPASPKASEPGHPTTSHPTPWIGSTPTSPSRPTPQQRTTGSYDVPGLHTPDADESRLVPAPLPVREYTPVPAAEPSSSPSSTATRPAPRMTPAAREWPSGLFLDDKGIAAQRGRAADVLVVEADGRSWATLTSLDALDAVRSSDAQVVVRTPMLPTRGFTLRECSAGAYTTQWTSFGKSLAGLKNQPIVDLGPAMNDSDLPWGGDPQGYASCFAEVARTVKSVAPQAVFQWTPAIGSRPGMPGDSVLAAWPGAGVVDVVGVDATADGRPWSEQVNGAYGLNYWASFADRHGKRIAVARWGVHAEAAADSAANPAYVRNMHDWVARVAAKKALAYEAYSEPSDVPKEIAAAYRALF